MHPSDHWGQVHRGQGRPGVPGNPSVAPTAEVSHEEWLQRSTLCVAVLASRHQMSSWSGERLLQEPAREQHSMAEATSAHSGRRELGVSEKQSRISDPQKSLQQDGWEEG